MKKILLFLTLCCFSQCFAQPTDCVTTASYTLTYQSTSGGNCTFLFTPRVTVAQSGASVKLARYTFTAGATSVSVCYSGNPAAVVNCSGSFTDLLSGTNLLFPSATVVLPCGNGSVTLTGSTSGQGTSTCTTQSVFSGPLPVKLLSFTGESRQEGIKLSWATEWESHNDGFDIQKSTNAQSFEAVGSVKGNATTDKLSTYEFVDKDVLAGQLYYYRLKQKDVDGAADYSRIIAVRHTLGTEMPAKVFPNANSGGSFMLSMLGAQSASINLYNQAGLEIPVLVSKTGDANLVSVSARNSLPSGIYILKALSADKAVQQSLKVIVQ